MATRRRIVLLVLIFWNLQGNANPLSALLCTAFDPIVKGAAQNKEAFPSWLITPKAVAPKSFFLQESAPETLSAKNMYEQIEIILARADADPKGRSKAHIPEFVELFKVMSSILSDLPAPQRARRHFLTSMSGLEIIPDVLTVGDAISYLQKQLESKINSQEINQEFLVSFVVDWATILENVYSRKGHSLLDLEYVQPIEANKLSESTQKILSQFSSTLHEYTIAYNKRRERKLLKELNKIFEELFKTDEFSSKNSDFYFLAKYFLENPDDRAAQANLIGILDPGSLPNVTGLKSFSHSLALQGEFAIPSFDLAPIDSILIPFVEGVKPVLIASQTTVEIDGRTYPLFAGLYHDLRIHRTPRVSIPDHYLKLKRLMIYLKEQIQNLPSQQQELIYVILFDSLVNGSPEPAISFMHAYESRSLSSSLWRDYSHDKFVNRLLREVIGDPVISSETREVLMGERRYVEIRNAVASLDQATARAFEKLMLEQ